VASDNKDDLSTLRALADRAEITDLLIRYTEGVRQNDADIIASVFSDDALLDFPRGAVKGIENIRTYFAGGLGPDKAKRRGLDALLDALPSITNVIIELNGDEAHSECTCISLTLAVRNGETVLGLGALRNIDEVVRTDKGWRIAKRAKKDLWTAEIPATSLVGG
jgi:hypothetical protein